MRAALAAMGDGCLRPAVRRHRVYSNRSWAHHGWLAAVRHSWAAWLGVWTRRRRGKGVWVRLEAEVAATCGGCSAGVGVVV
jgi:hypothetical protein